MAYGANITEPIVTTIGNPVNNQTYQSTGVAYDISIAGQPFFLLNDDNTPYRRVTAQYRKQQIDQTREPGEQTLTGWWLRSQSTFHFGQGIKFFEPAQDESLRFQYTYSKGCDVWTKGQVTLLNEVNETHVTTNNLQSNGRPYQFSRSIRWTKDGNTYDGVLMVDGHDADKIFPEITVSITNKALTSNVATLTTSAAHGMCTGMEITITGVDSTFNGTYRITSVPTTTTFTYAKTASNVASTPVSPAGSGVTNVIHFIDYNTGTEYPVYALCDDGVYAYWITKIDDSGVIKTAMYKKLLSADEATADTQMWKDSGLVVSNSVIEYTKERIVGAINNKVYEWATSASAIGTAVYTHPDSDVVFTAVSSSGAAIYLSAFSGIQSNIYKFTLQSSGAMPTLTSAITAAEMPVGEVIYYIAYYLGYMAIGTNKGLRVAQVSDTDGSLAYGPLIFESEQPVYDIDFRDKFLWCTTNVQGNPGVTRVNLGQEITNLVFAYAWDLYDPTVTGRYTTSCAFLGETARFMFTTNKNTTNGHVYIESANTKIATGILHTGYVRYNTLENKIFKYITPRFDTTNGSLNILSVDQNNNEYNIGSFAQGSTISDVGIGYPPGAQQYLGFEFTFNRSGTDSTKGPVFTGYQLKVLPAIPRQRLIQFPCSNYDSESDKFGNKAGYEGFAYDRVKTLEAIESNGDTLVISDFRTGETFTGIIEEIDFVNKTPTDKRYAGYGGTLMVTIRSIS